MTRTSKTMPNSGINYQQLGLRRIGQNRCSFEQTERVVESYGERGMSKKNGDLWPFSPYKQATLVLAFWRDDA